MLVPSTCKDIKMAGSQEPKSPFLVPKMGPKYHISLITAEKRSKTRNPINKAESPEFINFVTKFDDLYEKIVAENPSSVFFTGDLKAMLNP